VGGASSRPLALDALVIVTAMLVIVTALASRYTTQGCDGLTQ
jgi:hypothetical protein